MVIVIIPEIGQNGYIHLTKSMCRRKFVAISEDVGKSCDTSRQLLH